MEYTNETILSAQKKLRSEFEALVDKSQILKSPVVKQLLNGIKDQPAELRSRYGAEVNSLKNEIAKWVAEATDVTEVVLPLDVTAPWSPNTPPNKRPSFLPTDQGSLHPITTEIDRICDIFYRMGFSIESSREIDDDYHMFESLNFPEEHPARDDWDTFMTDEGLIAPAHTSTMQNRVLKKYASNLSKDEPIAVVVPDRVFRNEDLDATHEHTFHQVEGVYVGKGITVGNLVATLKAYLAEYFEQDLKVKIQPFYFPFTEPSFELAVERPKALRKGNTEADMWLELLGCGMIHPRVLEMAGIDPAIYTGFAWGCGVERLIMMKHGIEDIRHFNSGKLEFLRQF